ncbi:hypothetical protein LJ737_04890 [Hymenobacter sp. 15J16-1T3B]|uniref:hypothetical protein n=1 Tax=Hymenobacter sp. 15J16-1T3B TaxID=2886941 RepID=UPI001D106996|nr:hypothetical protein [Hymenobacter sp. 15J16-1T3B]MCC3156562.1 hypothetical protein [Hymenobacter sp. 15J16-1T3B]
MAPPLSKSATDRLGQLIKENNGKIDAQNLELLQNHRTSHKDCLSQTFNIICSLSETINRSAISTYRTKRFESIISKLLRIPEMRFSRMWDIGGCRCILANNDQVYQLRKSIYEHPLTEIVKENDYIQLPQADGYKSLHLYVKIKGKDKIIEIQIRNQSDHNWATLVEITDLIFDSKIKENKNSNKLSRFHYLLSRKNFLTINEKLEIRLILNEYKYFERLSMIFSKNYIQVRKQWLDIENKNTYNYFLIETTKDNIPKITAFNKFHDAEESYFNAYKENNNANIVLTHITSPDYNRISTAYSNYILTFHSFFTDYYDILEDLIIKSTKEEQYYTFFKIYNTYRKLIFAHIFNLIEEISEVNKLREKYTILNRKKEREWINDLTKQANQVASRVKKLEIHYTSSLPNNHIKKLAFEWLEKYTSRQYQARISHIINNRGLHA